MTCRVIHDELLRNFVETKSSFNMYQMAFISGSLICGYPQIFRKFNINLQTGPNAKPRDDAALHISVRLNQGYIARNSYVNGAWGDEEGNGTLTIGPAQSFEILILTDTNNFKVAVNGQHFCEYSHKIPFENISHLLIDGDVAITLISWELSVPPTQGEPAAEPSSMNVNSSQHFNANQNFPPNSYQPPPMGYNQSQYGPPMANVPPQAESGFSSFLDQAQEALAGAIKNVAAEKLLGSLLSSGDKQQQGYSHQNASYGLYPQLPPPDNLVENNSQNVTNRGPLETFLSGLLSNSNNAESHPNPSYTQTGPYQAGQPSVEKQGAGNLNVNDLSSLLANLTSGSHDSEQKNPQPAGQPNSYGQYPGAASQANKGPLESLLSGILPSGNNPQPQQPSVPQYGGEGSVGGLGGMGGILSNLAGQFLHNPRACAVSGESVSSQKKAPFGGFE
ncbi:hypothetical protein NQ315_007969 [Exocentrus adspersus]|uniref:Galectin n=1 Tax=Exocentrus adspersus TaxID=1586481 RepID=A0AAV8VF78_9CUCU|nr:hypothetical protein NQ315_007969 [Exocentrus adspersus]